MRSWLSTGVVDALRFTGSPLVRCRLLAEPGLAGPARTQAGLARVRADPAWMPAGLLTERWGGGARHRRLAVGYGFRRRALMACVGGAGGFGPASLVGPEAASARTPSRVCGQRFETTVRLKPATGE
jgi:hypothetical protein